MKPTTRGTLAAVVTGVAAAMGASAAPAAAAETVPVPVPLEGVEHSLNVKMPRLGGELPLLTPGAPEGPQYVEGRLLPASALPQVPLGAALPGVVADTPLPRVVGEGFEHVGVDAPAADLRTLTPGLHADTPLTSPNPQMFGLPLTKDAEVGLLAPVLRTEPTASLGLG
ncbi:hypothetical protein [Streptomyces sp. HM190]|uniref:hypothetical protein n=1 Tax=Streptomyces sp. HM190 TaxID=2695266 RepID=UPI00135CE9CD|nr:hypothetical protein [Streptomyces sp. HM190]